MNGKSKFFQGFKPEPAARPRRQVGALPVKADQDGTLRILLATSRQTRRWIIPKGWPIRRLKDHRAAEREALEEAGVLGRIAKTPLGSYLYWKCGIGDFALCEVVVYRLDVEREAATWLEQAERERRWFTLEEAVTAVDDIGLKEIIRNAASPLPPVA
jgi:8-oxo-dGTP pyrophosphatase MutT (NUDIX family)